MPWVSTSYSDGPERPGRRPRWSVAWAWGSRSSTSVLCPSAANAAARLTVEVVLPTPPFWFRTAIRRILGSLPDRGAGSRGDALQASHRLWARELSRKGSRREADLPGATLVLASSVQ